MQIERINISDCVACIKINDGIENLKYKNVVLYPGFLRTIMDTYNVSGVYYVCFKKKEIVGIGAFYEKLSLFSKNTLVSVPGGFWTETEEVENKIICAITDYTRNKKIKGPVFKDLQRPLLTLPSKKTAYRATRVVDGKFLQSYSKNIRRNLKNAQNKGLYVEESDDIKAFYDIWSTNMRDLGTPPIPVGFFMNLKANYQNNSQLLIVRKNGRCIGGSFILYTKDYATDLYISSLRSSFKDSPNVLLYHCMLKWAYDHGVKKFDLGRSQPGSGNERFKLRFGAQLEPLYSFPLNKTHTSKSYLNSFVVNSWKKLPLSVSNKVGPKIRRYIPFG